ncbi:unnamed protein product [Somion occarium]|uniref:Uncharacterized protein n=1 Tax=Somion occarium TaxID=3059160 RepID=A0ABP1DPD1_9APHY
MFNFFMTSVLLVFFTFSTVRATIFVTAPLKDSECFGGQPCTVQWVDNGVIPLLSNIGPCYVGLYNGDQVLVQQIEPVDIAITLSLSFIPNQQAGPDSNTYYINFTSVNPLGNSAAHYIQYSPFFRLTGMSGSFNSPVASATSSLTVPSSVASAPPNSISVTVTIPVTVGPPSVSPPSASQTLPVFSSPSAASSASSSLPTSSSSSSPTSSTSSSATSSSSSSPPSSLPSSSPSSSFTTSRISSPSSIPATSPSATGTTSSAFLVADVRLIPVALALSLLSTLPLGL